MSDNGDQAGPEVLPADQGQMMMDNGFDPSGESVDGGCDCEQCAGGEDPFGAGKHRYFNDLWTEVHAHRRTYVEVDYLSFWAKGNFVPPLVTTSPVGTPQSQAGVLPVSATTAILFGDTRLDTQQRNGARINFGYWLIDGEFLGIEGQYFALQQQNTLFHAASNFSTDPNAQILARPFTNVDPSLITPQQDSLLVAFPNFVIGQSIVDLNGSIDVRTTSDIQSANALLRRLIWIDFTMGRRLDLIAGYRFFRIDDSVTINDQTSFSGGLFPATTITSQDQFSARNQFHGGEIGLKGQSYHGPLQLELLAKVAFGNNHETMYINGFNSTTAGGTTTTGVGGLLTQPTNIGFYRRDVFAILPEANANIRFDLTRNLRVTAGYTFIYTNRVQRSGDAIDLTVNPTQIGGPLVGEARPAFAFHDTGFWVHGVNAGIEYRW